MQTSACIAELRQASYRQTTRVQRDLAGIGLQDKDVIDVCACCGEFEWGRHIAWELGNAAGGNTGVVKGEVVTRGELCGRSSYIRAVTDVEVAV